MRMWLALFVLVMGLGLQSAGPALAVEPDEVLEDPVLEARARELSKLLRCLVCQNENIDSSHAPLARDLRILLRERLVAGDTDEEVLDFLVERYGDFVLLRPPVQGNTMPLWIAPALMMLLGATGVVFYLRGRKGGTGEDALSAEEAERLKEVIGPDDCPR